MLKSDWFPLSAGAQAFGGRRDSATMQSTEAQPDASRNPVPGRPAHGHDL
ncbi:MAG: hypothetical protein ACI841_003959 [Planctomycetota bacterium]|jgi:hypothetical protein